MDNNSVEYIKKVLRPIAYLILFLLIIAFLLLTWLRYGLPTFLSWVNNDDFSIDYENEV